MKVTIEIDCTPVEARAFFGLPDVGPIQQAVMDDLEPKIRENMAALVDPEALVNSWFTLSGQGFEQFQKMMATAMASGGTAKK